MSIKRFIAFMALSFGLSACSMFNLEKEEVAAVSPKPVISKVAAKPAGAKGAAKCSSDGFCALPGLKKKP